MMNTKRTAGVALCIGALLFPPGCAGPSSGMVVDRNYSQAWDEMQMRCVTYDQKTGACTAQVPNFVHHPESCELRLVRTENGKTKSGWRAVPCSEYERYVIGDHYPKAHEPD